MGASTPPSTSRSTITLRSPTKYKFSSSSSAPAPPPLAWLHRTWTVSHSTLAMWRNARNVRITYAPLDPVPSGDGRPRLDDVVQYEARTHPHGAKTIRGIDTAVDGTSDAGAASWSWRGRGWMRLITSHWEILGWGERPLADGAGTERWAVTWFAATMFTSEGVDIYSDWAAGGSKELNEDIIKALTSMEAKPVADMCTRDMREVDISVTPEEG